MLWTSNQDREYDRLRGKTQSHAKQNRPTKCFSSVKAKYNLFSTMPTCKNVDKSFRHNVQQSEPGIWLNLYKIWGQSKLNYGDKGQNSGYLEGRPPGGLKKFCILIWEILHRYNHT